MADTPYYLYAGEKRLIVEIPPAAGQVNGIVLPDNNSVEAYCWARIVANFDDCDKACEPYEEYAYVLRNDGIPLDYLGKRLSIVPLDRVFAVSTTTEPQE
jgi:hypothetical protein